MSTSCFNVIAVTLLLALSAATAAAGATLTHEQQQTILQDALADYDRGVAYRRGDPAAAREAFERFLEDAPNHAKAGRVRAWLGKSR